MIEYLKDFLLSDDELARQEEQLQQYFRERLQQPDRLRTYMQLMMIAKLACKALNALDTKDFLARLKEELQTQSEHAQQQIQQQMADTKSSVEELCDKANKLQQEIKVRSSLVNDIIVGLGNVTSDSELSKQQEQVATLLADMERRMAALVELRNSQSFSQLLSMTAVNSAG